MRDLFRRFFSSDSASGLARDASFNRSDRFSGSRQQGLARLVAVAGVLFVALLVWRSAPQPVQIELDLGPAHQQFIELRVAYVQGGEELHGVAFSFPNGAPDRVRHSVRLPPGEFEVHTELRPLHGAWLASVEPLHTPNDSLIHINLSPRTR